MLKISWPGNWRHAQVDQFADRAFVAYAAAKLAGRANGRENVGDRLTIGQHPITGAVQIDQMQPVGAFLDPPPGQFGRIAKDGFLVVIALPQADTLAAAQVDGRIDIHLRKREIRLPKKKRLNRRAQRGTEEEKG
jgi:hypothetical protein